MRTYYVKSKNIGISEYTDSKLTKKEDFIKWRDSELKSKTLSSNSKYLHTGKDYNYVLLKCEYVTIINGMMFHAQDKGIDIYRDGKLVATYYCFTNGWKLNVMARVSKELIKYSLNTLFY